MKTIEKAKVELTIKRANSEIETVTTEEFGEISERIFNRIKEETAKAGRGEDVLGCNAVATGVGVNRSCRQGQWRGGCSNQDAYGQNYARQRRNAKEF